MSRVLRAIMPDGSVWHLPLELMATYRAQDEGGEPSDYLTMEQENHTVRWAQTNLDWMGEVAQHAERIFPADVKAYAKQWPEADVFAHDDEQAQ